MVLVKILKRNDAFSLVVAIIVGLIAGFELMGVANVLSATWLTDTTYSSSSLGTDAGFQYTENILAPTLTLLISLVVLEVLARLIIALRAAVGKR